jgi:hypothetical protein
LGSIPQFDKNSFTMTNDSESFLPFAVPYASSDEMDQNDIAIKQKRYNDRFVYRKSSDYPLDTTYQLPISGNKVQRYL